MSWKDVCQDPLLGEDCEAGLYGKIAVKKPLLRKHNKFKRRTKIWQ